MHHEQRARAHDLLRRQGLGRALFSDPASVAWLACYATPMQLPARPAARSGSPPTTRA